MLKITKKLFGEKPAYKSVPCYFGRGKKKKKPEHRCSDFDSSLFANHNQQPEILHINDKAIAHIIVFRSQPVW
ncbi:MAG: hypothetical protein ACI8R9_000342 [Paraglaciecola sp.]|jgi:hypothetical protein